MRIRLLSTLVPLLSISLYATPTTYNFTDLVDPSDVLLNPFDSYSYVHDITDNGFLPLEQKITSAEIFITLHDDEANEKDGDRVRIFIDNYMVAYKMEVDFADYAFTVNTKFLQEDGKLEVTLLSKQGDFIFKKSTLEATAVAVPEPGTMALTGLGLLGLAALARRRREK